MTRAAAFGARGRGQAEQDLVQDREPLAPAGREQDAVAQFGTDAAEDRLGGHVDVGQFAGRQAEQRPRAERPQRHLDAGLRAAVRDQRRGAVQPAQQGTEVARRLAGVGCASMVSGSSSVKIIVR